MSFAIGRLLAIVDAVEGLCDKLTAALDKLSDPNVDDVSGVFECFDDIHQELRSLAGFTSDTDLVEVTSKKLAHIFPSSVSKVQRSESM